MLLEVLVPERPSLPPEHPSVPCRQRVLAGLWTIEENRVLFTPSHISTRVPCATATGLPLPPSLAPAGLGASRRVLEGALKQEVGNVQLEQASVCFWAE